MGLGFLLFTIVFTIAYISTGETFMLVVYVLDLMFILLYNSLTKIHLTENSIVQKGLVRKKQIYFHQIRQVSLISMQRSTIFIKIDEITSPSLAIYQICVSKIQLADSPIGDYNISGKDYILFDYRPKAYKVLIDEARRAQ